MKFFKKYISKYWKGFCLAIVCLLVESICDLLQPTLMSRIVDIGVANNEIDFVVKDGIIMLIITGVGALGASGRNILSGSISQKFGAELRLDLFKKIQEFSFYDIDKFETGSLITRVTNDVTQIQNFVNGLMRIFVKAPIICIGSIIMAWRLDFSLSKIFFVIIPAVSLIIFLNMNIGYPYFIRVQKSMDHINSVVKEYLSGIRVIRAFNRSDYENNRFENANRNLKNSYTRAMRLMAVFSPGVNLIINLGIVFILWVGAKYVENGNIQVGRVMAFINYMTQISFSIGIIFSVFNMFVRFKASILRTGEIFAASGDENYNDGYEDFCCRGRIKFKNVCFSYENSREVLHNVSFSCIPGETVGIIGSTGSGKSSMVNLITRFYETTSGTIMIDGVDIKKIDKRALRNKIAIVPQHTMLFTGSIFDNIRWGNQDASYEDTVKVSKIAEVDEFVSKLPEGYNTVIGQGGVNFSGGQKQRISIARALIKKPAILILDDCTSALDTLTEHNIMNKIKRYSNRFTSIIISQKISSVIKADKIMVVHNGNIVGIGKHDYLIKNCKTYSDIYISQFGKDVI